MDFTNKEEIDFQDFNSKVDRLKGTRDFEKRKWVQRIMWAIVIVFAVFSICRIYSAWIVSQEKTQQEAITRSQITNHIPQWQITFKQI